MVNRRVPTFVLAAIVCLGSAGLASASPFDFRIGDNDGFGFGAAAVPDGSPLLNNTEPDINLAEADRRSAAEKLATNGAQQTDIYSAAAYYPGYSELPESFDVTFPFEGTLNSARFWVDMGGFETNLYGGLRVGFNGVWQPGLFDFSDGQFGTALRAFTLDAAALGNANLAHAFIVNIARGDSTDAISFDYFRLNGDLTPPPVAPEPTSLLLMGSGIAGLVLRRRRRA